MLYDNTPNSQDGKTYWMCQSSLPDKARRPAVYFCELRMATIFGVASFIRERENSGFQGTERVTERKWYRACQTLCWPLVKFAVAYV